jgi:predicted GNAT family acetyltransferase
MTNVNPDDLTVENNEAQSRFEIRIGDAVAVLEYELQGPRIVLIHTEVPKDLEGRGIGGKLASTALTYTREHNLKAVPNCPYVSAWLMRHPEFEDVVVREGQA